MYKLLEQCEEPELVVEAAYKDTLLSNESALAQLKTLGLQLDEELMGSKQSDKKLARDIMEEMVRQGRNGKMRASSVEHGARVASKLGLSKEKYGDIQRLMDAIRLVFGPVTLP